MKRIIEFQVLDEKYSFKENEISIFEIDKTNRQLNVKDFYEAFFAMEKTTLKSSLIIPLT